MLDCWIQDHPRNPTKIKPSKFTCSVESNYLYIYLGFLFFKFCMLFCCVQVKCSSRTLLYIPMVIFSSIIIVV